MYFNTALLWLVLLFVTPRCLADPGEGIIRARATNFIDKNCRRFLYSGWNSWELIEAAAGIGSALPRDNSITDGLPYVDYKLSIAKEAGLTVGRFFAHGHHPSILVLQTSPGVYNDRALRGLDQVLAAAAERSLKMVLTLADNWKDADSKKSFSRWAGKAPDEFYTDKQIRDWFKDHIVKMVNRVNSINGIVYKEDPAIFSWNLINEPRCECNIRAYDDACEKPCADTVQSWIEEMSLFLKQQDPNHMVTVGEEGFYGVESGREDQNPDVLAPVVDPVAYEEFVKEFNLTDDQALWAKRSGQDFVRNHDMVSIDYAAVHLWPDNWGGLPISFQSDWISAHGEDSAKINKPMVIEEFGKVAQPNDEETRSKVRDPYLQDVYNTFDSLRGNLPLRGIAFWRFDGRSIDPPTGHTVYPTHRAFQNIITPSARRLKEDIEEMEVVEDCQSGSTRSYDIISLTDVDYLTAGPSLVAVEEGDDASWKSTASSVESCLEKCKDRDGCQSVIYNQRQGLCYLKDKGFDDDVELRWSPENWQSFWRAQNQTMDSV